MSDVEISKTNGEAEKSVKQADEKMPEIEETAEEAEQRIEKQIETLVNLFEDPGASFEEKMRSLIQIPKDLQHKLLTRERADRLFSSIPIEMYQRVFEPKHVEYAYVRPVLMHILGFLVQCTSPDVNLKFKPLLDNVLKAASPKENKAVMTGMVYNDVAVIVAVWANERGEGKYVYEALRCTTGFFVSQKDKLEVAEFLLSIRILINKIYQIAPLESPESFDNRGWPVAILSVIRKLLREKTEKFTNEMRSLMWEVISAMTRVSGIGWFDIDKSFTKLVIQMNHVELRMSLHDPENIDPLFFCRHLRILELYTTAICEREMYGEEGNEIIPQTVGDSTRYILEFWVECHLQKIKLTDQLNLSIFNFATYLFVHDELALNDEKVRKHIGLLMLDSAFMVLRECAPGELRGDVGQMFSEIIEKLSEFELLDDRIPLLLIKYLDKIRGSESYDDWKGRVVDCKCCLMDLRGRVDWYSIKSINDAKQMLSGFTEPEQHEIRAVLFPILDKLPRVK